MPEVFNIYEAKTKLSQLIERALKGENIIIARAGKPLVELKRIEKGTRDHPARVPGRLKGKLWIAPDAFSSELDTQVAADFHGSEIFPAE